MKISDETLAKIIEHNRADDVTPSPSLAFVVHHIASELQERRAAEVPPEGPTDGPAHEGETSADGWGKS